MTEKRKRGKRKGSRFDNEDNKETGQYERIVPHNKTFIMVLHLAVKLTKALKFSLT